MSKPSFAEPFGHEAAITLPGGQMIRMDTPNEVTEMRARTLLTKEPETIAWIDSFEPDDVLYDVGANVGVYTLYAAIARKVRVFAFEPESQNYGLLNRNLFLNRLTNVTAYCMGLSDKPGFTHLELKRFVSGGSLHQVDGAASGHPLGHRQGCVATSLDDFVESSGLPPPTHIKIDVDGIEAKVVAGATRTLR